MKVFIDKKINGEHTKDTQGWDRDMDKYIGTVQTVKHIYNGSENRYPFVNLLNCLEYT
jgi:hypothetical protein